MKYERSQWVRALSAVPKAELKTLIAQLCEGFQVSNTAMPQSGMGIVRMIDTALGEPFYLGEIPISSARVSVTASHGEPSVCENFEGAAQIMDEDESIAIALAIADAILANKLQGCSDLELLVEQGMAIVEKRELTRQHMLSSTNVDFSDFYTDS